MKKLLLAKNIGTAPTKTIALPLSYAFDSSCVGGFYPTNFQEAFD